MSIGQIFKNALDDVSVKFSWFLTRMFRYTDHDRGYFTVDAELEDGKPLRIVESIVRSEALLVTEAPDILDRLIKTRGLKDYNAFLSGQEARLAEERAKLAGALVAESIGDLVEKMKTKTQNPEEEIAG